MCDKRPVRCGIYPCEYVGPLDTLEEHRCRVYACSVRSDKWLLYRESEDCAGKKVACPDGCGEIVARGLLSAHHEVGSTTNTLFDSVLGMQVCPRASIPCRNASFGCMWSGGRLQYDQHIEQCWFEKSRDFLTKYTEEMDKLRDEMHVVNLALKGLLYDVCMLVDAAEAQ